MCKKINNSACTNVCIKRNIPVVIILDAAASFLSAYCTKRLTVYDTRKWECQLVGSIRDINNSFDLNYLSLLSVSCMQYVRTCCLEKKDDYQCVNKIIKPSFPYLYAGNEFDSNVLSKHQRVHPTTLFAMRSSASKIMNFVSRI
jgi:hypothetical protein